MEKKIQYSFKLLSMLFLAFTVVSAKENPNNLYSVVYVGDTNVTVGKPFWIQCLAEGPIEWHKDDEPIQPMHFIRHSKDSYGYSQQDNPDGQLITSTISVKHALKLHSGKYKCNMKHEKSHMLNVHDTKSVIVELDNENGSMEDEYDDRVASRVSFEQPIVGDDALKSTMMMLVDEVSESSRLFSSNFDESYEQLREDIMESDKKISDKIFEFEDVLVTTEAITTTTKISKTSKTTTQLPKHDTSHKHNKHKTLHEPFIPHDSLHEPHEKSQESENVHTKSHSTLLHDANPTIPLTTEHAAKILNDPKNHHKGKLDAAYDNVEHEMIMLKLGKALELSCSAPDTTKITWMKNNVDVNKLEELKGHFQIFPKEGKFYIEKARDSDAGNYSCHLDNESKNFNVWAQVLVKIPQNIYVVENDKLEITCIVRGTNPIISWHYSNSSDENSATEILRDEDGRIKLEDHGGVESSRLVIDHVNLSDRGTYYCRGSNEVMAIMKTEDSSSDGMVRVKGKLAALWPFLGICAEVFILCTIILIYEKRRNKTDLDESDTDQSPDQKNDHHIKDSDVRQRK